MSAAEEKAELTRHLTNIDAAALFIGEHVDPEVAQCLHTVVALLPTEPLDGPLTKQTANM